MSAREEISVQVAMPEKLEWVFDGPARYRGAWDLAATGGPMLKQHYAVEQDLIDEAQHISERDARFGLRPNSRHAGDDAIHLLKEQCRVRDVIGVVGLLALEISRAPWNGGIQQVVDPGPRRPPTNLLVERLQKEGTTDGPPINDGGPFRSSIGDPAAIAKTCLALIFLDQCRHSLPLCPRELGT